MSALEVLATGPLTLVQDLGRAGWASLGVGRSGAFDRGALRLANRLVGNREDAVGLEVLGGGLSLRAAADCVVSVTGADGQLDLLRDERPAPASRRSPLQLRSGDVLHLGTPYDGLRSYLALRGALRAPVSLGSASRDTLAGLGPAPVAVGDVLAVAGRATTQPLVDHAPARAVTGAVRVLRGPRDDWFTAEAVERLLTAAWTVSPRSDRIGVRLDGPVLTRRDPGAELPSEPVVPGAIQVPPDGRPVVLGPDAPTTGGYPVIAVVVDADLDRLAQCSPGQILDIREMNVA